MLPESGRAKSTQWHRIASLTMQSPTPSLSGVHRHADVLPKINVRLS
jgi:hypothetical protein